MALQRWPPPPACRCSNAGPIAAATSPSCILNPRGKCRADLETFVAQPSPKETQMSTTIQSPRSSERSLAARYAAVRSFSRTLCETLEPEDCCIQSMPDVSPTRWHLAHTTWFFETFILAAQKDYQPRHTHYRHLFNSYYNAIGKQFPRERRGLLSRPTVAQVMQYRREIDDEMSHLLAGDSLDPHGDLAALVELGLNHEQQHQELMLTDIKHVLSCNPLFPTYRPGKFSSDAAPHAGWTEFDEGLYQIGHAGEGFAYDNESPRHRVFLESFRISNRLVTCGEYLEFIDDGGYSRPELWLSDGWKQVGSQNWQAPMYWHKIDGQWHEFTLAGLRPLNEQQPVCHLSFFEADAFARWAGVDCRPKPNGKSPASRCPSMEAGPTR